MRWCTSDRALRTAFAVALAALHATAIAALPAREQQALAVSQAAIGRAAGDWPLVDQRGRAFRLSELRGRPLVVTFIYTGCFEVCPTSTRFLRDAVVQARAALGADAFGVLAIGFNQPFDSPAALADFARKHGVEDADWLLAAPRVDDVEPLLARFGFSFDRRAGGFEHLVQASIVDADGRIAHQLYGDSFELPLMVGPLKDLLSNTAARTSSLDAVWTKVKLYCTVFDPTTGRYRLDYSLFVELLAGLSVLAAMLAFIVREWRRGRAA
jgi:protein SCO1/2